MTRNGGVDVRRVQRVDMADAYAGTSCASRRLTPVGPMVWLDRDNL